MRYEADDRASEPLCKSIRKGVGRAACRLEELCLGPKESIWPLLVPTDL